MANVALSSGRSFTNTWEFKKPLRAVIAAVLVLFHAIFAQAIFTSAAHASEEDAKTTIGVMIFDGVLTSDVVAPLEVFGAAIANETVKNYEVVTIAPQAGQIKTHEGLTLTADYGVADAPDVDVILVGSSYDMDTVLNDQAFMAYVREQGGKADWIASNCSGVYVLAEAGLMKGVRATTYIGGEVWLKLHHPSVKIDLNETVVVDGNAVTSNGSVMSYAAAFQLLELMEGEKASNDIADLLYYTRLLDKHGRPNT